MAHPPTQSYLLRLWREHPTAPLRVTLTPVSRPDAPRHFADLETLFAFLRTEEGGAVLPHDEHPTT